MLIPSSILSSPKSMFEKELQQADSHPSVIVPPNHHPDPNRTAAGAVSLARTDQGEHAASERLTILKILRWGCLRSVSTECWELGVRSRGRVSSRFRSQRGERVRPERNSCCGLEKVALGLFSLCVWSSRKRGRMWRIWSALLIFDWAVWLLRDDEENSHVRVGKSRFWCVAGGKGG